MTARKFQETTPTEPIDERKLMMCALRFNAAFAQWPIAAVERLLSSASLKSYAKGCRIASEPQERSDVLVIVSGHLLMRRRMPDGRVNAVGIVGPGRIVSAQCDFNLGTRLDLEYSAHDNVMVIHVSHQELFALLDANPRLWRGMGAAVLLQQREFLETVIDQNRGCASKRLASLILRFSELYGVQLNPDGCTQLRMRLSQEDLAALLQSSRQTINEVLSEFKVSGHVRLDYSAISILDRSALQKLACRTSARAG